MSDTSLIFTIFAIDKATNTLAKTGSAVTKMALGVAAAGATIALKTTTMAANFETNMNKVQTSAGELHSNMAMVSDGILNLAGTVGDSTRDLAAGLYTVESGGLHGADALVALQAAAEGAKAEQADLTTVSDALTSALADYHLKASDSALVTSEMVTAVGLGKTNFELFAGSLHSVLPLASQLHVPLADILGDLAAITLHGESADQATQNMADALRHLAAPTIAQTKYLGQLGVDSSKLAGMLSTKGLSGTMQYLSQVILTKMGPSGKLLLGQFYQSKSAGADVQKMIATMTPAMQDLAHQFMAGKITGADWTSALKGMPPLQANLMRQFATLEKRATGFSDVLKQGGPEAQTYIQALKAVTGDATGLNVALMLTGENTDVVNANVAKIAATTTEAGNHVRGWSEVQATFNQHMAETKGQIEAVGIRIGNVLLPYAGQLIDKVSQLVTWFGKHRDIAGALALTIGTLAAATLLYKGYLLAVNVGEKVGLGLQAAKKGVMGLVTAVQWAYNGALAVANSRLWTWLGFQALELAGWVRKAAIVVANTAVMIAHEVAIAAVTTATKLWAAAQWLINVAMDANPVGLIIIAIAAVIAIIVLLWNNCKPFRDFMIGMWDAIWSVLKAVGHWFAHDFVDFWVGAWDWILDKLKTAVLWVHGKIEFVKSILSTMWDTAKLALHLTIKWITDKWDGIVHWVEGLGGKIAHAASGMWDGIKNAFKGAVNWIIDGWNALHFKIPDINFLGVHIPGFNLGLPQIPHLARGGEATAGGAVLVGDAGPEIMYMPRGASVRPLGSNSPGGGGPCVHVHVHSRVAEAVVEFGEHIRGNYGGNVQAAMGGYQL